MVDLGSRVIGLKTITNSGKSTLGSRVNFGSRANSKSNNLISYFFPSMKCDYLKEVIQFQNLWIQESMLPREMGLTWVRIPESTWIQKLKLNHKVFGRGHSHVQVQFH